MGNLIDDKIDPNPTNNYTLIANKGYIDVSYNDGSVVSYKFDYRSDDFVIETEDKQIEWHTCSFVIDGDTIHMVDVNSGLRAYTFDGSIFNLITKEALKDNRAIYYDGSYIYVGSVQLSVYSFDGTSYKLIDTSERINPIAVISGYDSYIFTGELDNIVAYTFDGEKLLFLGSERVINWLGNDISCGNGFVFVTTVYPEEGLKMYSFDGEAFTLIDEKKDNLGIMSTGVALKYPYIYTSWKDKNIAVYEIVNDEMVLSDFKTDTSDAIMDIYKDVNKVSIVKP